MRTQKSNLAASPTPFAPPPGIPHDYVCVTHIHHTAMIFIDC